MYTSRIVLTNHPPGIRLPMLPGDGQAPLAAIVSLLRAQQFAGSVSLEWEKLWHPYLPPLRTALVRLQAQPWFAPLCTAAASALRGVDPL